MRTVILSSLCLCCCLRENARDRNKSFLHEQIIFASYFCFLLSFIASTNIPSQLEPTGECNIALTPCAHKFCSECIIAVLSSASSSREAVGKCPECREVIRRSELTFLSDAEDAGESKIPQKKEDEDKKPAAKTSLKTNVKGFELNTQEIVAETADSATKRKYYKPIDEQEMVKLQTRFHTLSPGFLADVEAASSCIGTKTSRFLDEIKKMKEQDPKSKCVVFTLYEDLLDLLAGELYCRKIDFVRIDGNMKQHQRADALERFSNNPDTKVFLLSMRAGATGLNLISADHCFILDPPLNTAIEEQAIDRYVVGFCRGRGILCINPTIYFSSIF